MNLKIEERPGKPGSELKRNLVTKFDLIVEFLNAEGYQQSAKTRTILKGQKTYKIVNHPDNNKLDIDTAFHIKIWPEHTTEYSIEGKEENTHVWISCHSMSGWIHDRINLVDPSSLSKLIDILNYDPMEGYCTVEEHCNK